MAVYGKSLRGEIVTGRDYHRDEITDALFIVLTELPVWESIWPGTKRNLAESANFVYAYNDLNKTGFNDIIDLIDQAIIKVKEGIND
jgi:hypothetical protein